MANEIQFTDVTGRTNLDYVNITNPAGQWWNRLATVLETFNPANWLFYTGYAQEFGTSRVYGSDFPPLIPAGVYNVVARFRAGAQPAQSDPVVAVGSIEWGGAAGVVSPSQTLDLAEADEVIVTGPAGWTLEYRRKGTGVVLMTKQLKKLDGSPLTSESTTVGRKVQ